MHNDGFNKTKERHGYEKSAAKHLANGTITKEDDELIRRFISSRRVEKNIGETRARALGVILAGWRRFIKVPYDKVSIDDIHEGIAAIKKGTVTLPTPLKNTKNTSKGHAFAQNSIREHIKVLKSFLTWLSDEGIIDVPEKKLKKIQAPRADFDTERAEDLLGEEDVLLLVKACTSSRDRALIWTTYETAARISEMGRVTIKDLKIEPDMITVRIEDEKTGRERFAHVVKGIPYLTSYLNDRGDVPRGDYLFKLYGNKPLTYTGVSKILELVTKRSGLSKRVHWHLLRKSRITNMVAEGYRESYVREVVWANQATAMFKPYLKLNGRVQAAEARRMNGIETETEKKKDESRRVKCQCGKVNEPTARYCAGCARPLTEAAISAQKSDEAAALELLQNPVYLQKKLAELEVLKRQVEDLTRSAR